MNAFMSAAIQVAQEGASMDEIPVGAVVVYEGEIIATAHNERIRLCDPTAHAEILALRRAAKKRSDWRLEGCDLYVTLMPCPMCMAAIRGARIRRLYCGAYASGALVEQSPEIYYGIEEDACAALLKSFFRDKR